LRFTITIRLIGMTISPFANLPFSPCVLHWPGKGRKQAP
jgi:hypothetical protein